MGPSQALNWALETDHVHMVSQSVGVERAGLNVLAHIFNPVEALIEISTPNARRSLGIF